MSFDQDKRRKTYALSGFENYPGLTIHCREPGYRAMRELGAAVLVLGDDLTGAGLAGDALLDAFEPLFTALERSVIRWDLLDGGRTVPLSQLQDQDLEFLLEITRTWYERVVQGRHPQPVDNPGDNPLEDYSMPAAAGPVPDSPLPPTIGEDGTDEEWLAQFAAHTPPPGAFDDEDDSTDEVGPATNEPPVPADVAAHEPDLSGLAGPEGPEPLARDEE